MGLRKKKMPKLEDYTDAMAMVMEMSLGRIAWQAIKNGKNVRLVIEDGEPKKKEGDDGA